LESKGFRQVKLISTIAHTKNANALGLCADLCLFEDIAAHIAEHDVPFLGMDEFEWEILRIYNRLLSHARTRMKVSELLQPVFLGKKLMKGNEKYVCNVLRNIDWAVFGEVRIFELDLISTVADAVTVCGEAFAILGMILEVCGAQILKRYEACIEGVVRRCGGFNEKVMRRLKGEDDEDYFEPISEADTMV
jgi:hypothetical protein